MVTRVSCLLGLGLGLLLLPVASFAAKHKAAPKPKVVHQQNQKNQGPPKTEQVTLDGTVTAVGSGRLQMTADGKAHKDWTVTATPMTRLLVTGTAKADFLRAGLTVKFIAELDAQGTAKDKLIDLSIVAASPENLQGVTAEGGQSKVVGRISSCHGGKLTVHAGTRTVQAELADDPKIDVSAADGSMIMAGAKISVHGKFIQGQPGLCEADDVKVTLTEPLVGKKKPGLPSALKPVAKPILTDKDAGAEK